MSTSIEAAMAKFPANPTAVRPRDVVLTARALGVAIEREDGELAMRHCSLRHEPSGLWSLRAQKDRRCRWLITSKNQWAALFGALSAQ